MSALDAFWAAGEEAYERLYHAQSATEVVEILNSYGPPSSGDAFYQWSGGDNDMLSALMDAGWRTNWVRANYYWSAHSPAGDDLHYVEGDVYLGRGKPL